MSKKPSPFISVIMPCYNHGKYLSEAIESVITQNYDNWELIIVDDGSTDNSSEVAKHYVEKDNRISYIYQRNAGPSAARNRGVKKSRGKYLHFLDGDDKISSKYLSTSVAYMENHKECKVFYSRCKFFGEREMEFHLNYIDYKHLLCQNSIVMACVIRREDFELIGGFDENMRGYEDWELFIRLLYHNDIIYKHPEVLFFYRIHNNPNSVNKNAAKKSSELTSYVYQKHIEKYREYIGEPQSVYVGYCHLQSEIDKIFNSKTYKIGKFFLAPFSFLKKYTSSKNG